MARATFEARVPTSVIKAWTVHKPKPQQASKMLRIEAGKARRDALPIRVPLKANSYNHRGGAPGQAEIVLPPSPGGQQRVRLWLVPGTATRPQPPQCSVRTEIKGGGQSHVLTLPVSHGAAPGWHEVAMVLPADADTRSLRITMEAVQCEANGQLYSAVTAAETSVTSQQDGRNNQLVLMIDALRYDHLDCTETSKKLTPTLYERVCQRGTSFENAFSPSPWTYPAIASILTGMLPFEHGGFRDGRDRKFVRPGITTAPQILGAAGYSVAAVVANGNGDRRLWHGTDDYIAQHARQNKPNVLRERRADRLVREANQWLSNQPTKPFFMWLHLIDIHEPVDAAKEMPEGIPASCKGVEPIPYRWQQMGRPPEKLTSRQQRRGACRRDLYKASLLDLDRQLAVLFDHLDALGLSNNTDIIVASDHGEEIWDHHAEQAVDHPQLGRWGVDHGHTHYHELMHVPLILVPAPNRNLEDAPRRVSDLVSVRDLYATMLEWAAIVPSNPSTSRSLVPALHGDSVARRRVMAQGSLYGLPLYSVTTPKLRVIHRGDDKVLVFSRFDDPQERTPITEGPLWEQAQGVLRDSSKIAPPEPPSEAELEALKALGYVGE